MANRRIFIIAVLLTLFSLLYLRLVIWSDAENPLITEYVDSSDANVLDPEWEWVRNISIVYTWVNGSDNGFRDQRISYGGKEAGGVNLDRDNDELLYSLRSLSKYLPWHTGKIYVVTQNQVPAWLNISHPRIQMVNHTDIIPTKLLPTYNSNVLDSYLHLIPGLSDVFLYFNDDVFLYSPLHPSDLFSPHRGLKLFVEDLTIPFDSTQQLAFIDGVKDKSYWRAFFGTIRLVEETVGKQNMNPLRLLQHTSHAFHRGAIERIHNLWAEEFQVAHRNKFREDNDILFIYAYYGYLAHQGWDCCNLKQETFEVEGKGDRMSFLDDTIANARAMKRLKGGQQRALFLNINDMMGNITTAYHARGQLIEFLQEEFGIEQSPFEVSYL